MIRYLYRFGFELAKLYWLIRRPKSQGAVAIIFYDSEVLLIRNTYGRGRWVFPGGGSKNRESLEDTVCREVCEEVGITLGKVKSIGSWIFTEYHRHDTTYFFEAQAKSKEIKTDPNEIADARWFKLTEIPAGLGISAIRGLELLQRNKKDGVSKTPPLNNSKKS